MISVTKSLARAVRSHWLSYEYDTAEGPHIEEIEEAPEDRQFAFRALSPDVDQVLEIISFAAFVF